MSEFIRVAARSEIPEDRAIAVAPGSDHDEIQRTVFAGDRRLALGQFVGQQNAPPNLQRVLNGFESGGKRFPLVAARAAPIDPQLGVGWIVLRVALDRDDVDGFRLVRVNVNREPEIGRQVAAHFAPQVTGVIATHHVPMLLHKEHARTRRVHGDVMDAVAHLGVRIGNGT